MSKRRYQVTRSYNVRAYETWVIEAEDGEEAAMNMHEGQWVDTEYFDYEPLEEDFEVEEIN